MGSRAALLDPQSRKPIAVERAELDKRWQRLVVKASMSFERSRRARNSRIGRSTRKPGDTLPM